LNVGGPESSAAEPLPLAWTAVFLQPDKPASIPAKIHSAMLRAQDKVMVISCVNAELGFIERGQVVNLQFEAMLRFAEWAKRERADTTTYSSISLARERLETAGVRFARPAHHLAGGKHSPDGNSKRLISRHELPLPLQSTQEGVKGCKNPSNIFSRGRQQLLACSGSCLT
jgi:hypothetical protein